jgi:ATP-dependent DNA helicase RecQ
VCDPSLVPASPSRAVGPGPARPGSSAVAGTAKHESVEEAIVAVVRVARPSIGRTRVAEVLRGGQAKALIRNSWDGLPEYGTYAHLTAKSVLDRIDALLDAGRLESTGGPRPVLRVAAGAGGDDGAGGGAGQPSLSFEAA